MVADSPGMGRSASGAFCEAVSAAVCAEPVPASGDSDSTTASADAPEEAWVSDCSMDSGDSTGSAASADAVTSAVVGASVSFSTGLWSGWVTGSGSATTRGTGSGSMY